MPVISEEPLPAAIPLFRCLCAEGLRFGVFKSTRTIPDGLAGAQDIDILVHREDYTRFCEILSSFHGRRGIAHGMLTSIGREDWFIPDFAYSRYLHLDVHVEVRLGGKFNKRYPAFRYDDITEWVSRDHDGCPVPQSSSLDEARITLGRIAFRQPRWPGRSWAILKGDWTEEIRKLLFPDGAPHECVVIYEQLSGAPGCACRLRREVFQALAKATLYISASKWEGIGVANLEAAALGCWPFLSRIPAHEEIGDTLHVPTYPLAISEEWVAGIDNFMNLPSEKRAQMCNRLSEQARAHFDLDESVSKYICVYKDLAARARYKRDKRDAEGGADLHN